MNVSTIIFTICSIAIWLFSCWMLHYFHQFVHNFVIMSLGAGQVVYSRFIRAFSLKTTAWCAGNRLMGVVWLNQNRTVVGRQTKTMTWKNAKMSCWDKGDYRVGSLFTVGWLLRATILALHIVIRSFVNIKKWISAALRFYSFQNMKHTLNWMDRGKKKPILR